MVTIKKTLVYSFFVNKEWADAVLFINYKTMIVATEGANKAQGGKRVIYTTHHPCWDAKNRFGLPEQMPLDMAAIMEAITNGNGGDKKALEIEIKGLIESLPKEKADKTLEWLKKPHTVTDLQKVLNNIKNTIKWAENG